MRVWEMPRGFTLIEVLIVLSVVCVVALWALPSFVSVSNTAKMARLATELNGLVVMAKSQAVLRRQPLWIHLLTVSGEWALELTDNKKEFQGVVLMRLSGASFSGIKLDTTYSSNQISFDATHGRPKSGRFTFYPSQQPELVLELRTHFRSAIVRVCSPNKTHLGYEVC
ncbi:GspH/FimT family pseudopilin [Vibrio sp. Isolate25]|uniref:GspH/FimT family pseudopilin n=1 Tax=Vibrio sp. Isolate25 TaxID=2908535 RepID=UPI001EFCCD73|nr:GspH/FimT family pseudopilin [Vibrio sp. Isolate25]MCG9598270.1 GspH/FimT family pseudopilin [Vibrio sp. Isolate25]